MENQIAALKKDKLDRLKEKAARDEKRRVEQVDYLNSTNEVQRLEEYCSNEANSDYREGLRLMNCAALLNCPDLQLQGLNFVKSCERRSSSTT